MVGTMRFGIIGTGSISDWFVAACRRAGGAPVGVYSRGFDRGQDFATRHGLSLVAATMEDLAGSDQIDAVYVASPIGSHYEHVLAALAAGKHVLCEKTLATSPEAVRALFDVAASRERVLLEAVRPVHDPAYEVIAKSLARLGMLRHAHFEKCQYSSRYSAFLQGATPNPFDPASGNSALRDLGVYCLHPSLTLFGAPESFSVVGYHLSNGFGAGGTLLLDYGTLKVTCAYSKVTNSVAPSVIYGETGSLSIDSIAEPGVVIFTGLDGQSEIISSVSQPKVAGDTLHYPIETFLRLCESGAVDHPFRAQSVMAEEIMSRGLESVPGSVAPIWHLMSDVAERKS